MRRLSAFILIACSAGAPAVADTGLDGVERARLHRALHLLETGSAAEAAMVFEGIVSTEASRPKAIIGLARAYESLGRTQEAEATWRRLPTDAVAMEGLALLLLESRPEESLALARRLQALRLEDAHPHLLESRAALASGELDEAVGAATRYAGGRTSLNSVRKMQSTSSPWREHLGSRAGLGLRWNGCSAVWKNPKSVRGWSRRGANWRGSERRRP